MKIRLEIGENNYDEVRQFFENKGIEIAEDSRYVLTETDSVSDQLCVRDTISGEKKYVNINSILYLESYGHQIDVTTEDNKFVTNIRLYQLEEMLDSDRFVRISKSVIIAKKKVKEIKPSFSMKFTLVMSDNTKLEVTRNYYSSFKEAFHI